MFTEGYFNSANNGSEFVALNITKISELLFGIYTVYCVPVCGAVLRCVVCSVCRFVVLYCVVLCVLCAGLWCCTALCCVFCVPVCGAVLRWETQVHVTEGRT
jgi:hypothetical protein